MQEFHLHRDSYSKLQLDIHESKSYCNQNADHCYMAHRHSFYQLIWFKRAGRHYVDHQEYQHGENTIFCISKGQVHKFCPDSENEGYLIHFNEIFFKKKDTDVLKWTHYSLFNEMANPMVAIPSDWEFDFQFFMDKLIEEIHLRKHNYKEQLSCYLQILLLRIERQKQNGPHPLISDAHFVIAVRFDKLVDDAKNHSKNVGHFSSLLNVSDKTLNTISKKFFRRTAANFIHDKKVLEAKRMLTVAKLSIKEISFQLGFDQPTNFTKYFKRHTGFTPKAFREQIR